MDTFELNKIAGAVLGSALFLMVINEVGNILVHPERLEENVIGIEAAEEGADTAAAAAPAEPEVPLPVLLAEADAAEGAKVARKCGACHTFEEGGANKIGPHLFGVLGRDIASVEGFGYSDALTEKPGEWTYEKIAHFIENPKEFAPGTKMAFAGVKDAEDRADLLLYLRQQNASPPPLPEPQAQPQAEGQPPAESGQGAATEQQPQAQPEQPQQQK